MNRDMPIQAVRSLLSRAGLGGDFVLEKVKTGGNNMVFRVRMGAQSFLLKQYFHHADDRRDRLGAEYSFSEFAWSRGVRALPRPIACDAVGHLGLYEFVEGSKVEPGMLAAGVLDQAANFVQDVNQHRFEPGGKSLADASEACFSIADHVECVERRIRRLDMLALDTATARQASDFVRGDLADKWRECRSRADGWKDRTHVMPAEDRCISPSDFGFHNAIREPDGRMRFVDFEYAGWDDPAKLVCDFFCQPQVPVPLEFFRGVAIRIANVAGRASACLERVSLLLPVYQIKWCCIMLNAFLPVGRDRGAFLGLGDRMEEHRQAQLDKAAAALARLDMLASASC